VCTGTRAAKTLQVSMSIQAVLLPVFVQVGLTFFLLFWMATERTTSIRRGEVKMRDIALRQPGWNEDTTKVGNAFHSQLEVPVLFYVLVVLAIIARKADLLFVIMSWLFVASRIVHVAIHVGSNYVPNRFYAFIFGVIVLLLMWIIFAIRVLLGLG
jgi:hypothetical protein